MEQSGEKIQDNNLVFTLGDDTEVDVSKFPSMSNAELKELEEKLSNEFESMKEYLQVIMVEMEKYSAAYNLISGVLRHRNVN